MVRTLDVVASVRLPNRARERRPTWALPKAACVVLDLTGLKGSQDTSSPSTMYRVTGRNAHTGEIESMRENMRNQRKRRRVLSRCTALKPSRIGGNFLSSNNNNNNVILQAFYATEDPTVLISRNRKENEKGVRSPAPDLLARAFVRVRMQIPGRSKMGKKPEHTPQSMPFLDKMPPFLFFPFPYGTRQRRGRAAASRV